jgi:hypothetical protein
MVRLLKEAARHGNDPELFAGLVHACRYCGLFEQAIAAHGEARRLDPNVPTSYSQTLLMTCDFDRVLAAGTDKAAFGSGDDVIHVIALGFTGRLDDARAALERMKAHVKVPAFQAWMKTLYAWLDRRPDLMQENRAVIGPLTIMDDPEASFQEGWLLCDAGGHREGLPALQRAVAKGYAAAPTLAAAPQFDALRGDPAFQQLVRDAEEGRARALAAFREAGGDRLLGNLWQWEGRFQRLEALLGDMKADEQG